MIATSIFSDSSIEDLRNQKDKEGIPVGCIIIKQNEKKNRGTRQTVVCATLQIEFFTGCLHFHTLIRLSIIREEIGCAFTELFASD